MQENMTEFPEGAITAAAKILAFRFDSKKKLESAINVCAQRARGWYDQAKQELGCDYDEALIISALIESGISPSILSNVLSRPMWNIIRCYRLSPILFPVPEVTAREDIYPWIYRILATGLLDREALMQIISQARQLRADNLGALPLNTILKAENVTTMEILKVLQKYGK